MGERSAYEDGLPALYVLKGTLILFAIVLGLQLLSSICTSLAVLLGAKPCKIEGSHG